MLQTIIPLKIKQLKAYKYYINTLPYTYYCLSCKLISFVNHLSHTLSFDSGNVIEMGYCSKCSQQQTSHIRDHMLVNGKEWKEFWNNIIMRYKNIYYLEAIEDDSIDIFYYDNFTNNGFTNVYIIPLKIIYVYDSIFNT